MLKIGIVGGCLNMPMCSVGMNSIYHRQFKRSLKAQGVEARIHLEAFKDSRVEQICSQFDYLNENRGCDYIAYQIRPSVLINLSRLVWKLRTTKSRFPLRLSPFFKEDFLTYEHTPTLTPTVQFHTANHKLARITGLLAKASKHLANHLSTLSQWAKQPNHPDMIFISPVFGNSFPRCAVNYWSRELGVIVDKIGNPLVDLSDLSHVERPELWEPDGYHVNQDAHTEIAQRLLDCFDSVLGQYNNKLCEQSGLVEAKMSVIAKT